MKTNNQLWISIICLFLTGICVYLEGVEWLESIRVVLGSLTLLFIPGRWLGCALFMSEKVDLFDRIVLSFALSIAIVPIIVFYLNLIGIPISARLVLGVVGSIVCCSYRYQIYKNRSPIKII